MEVFANGCSEMKTDCPLLSDVIFWRNHLNDTIRTLTEGGYGEVKPEFYQRLADINTLMQNRIFKESMTIYNVGFNSKNG